MTDDEDVQLANALQHEIDYYSQPGGNAASAAAEQDWLNTARLAVRSLRIPHPTEEQREAARHTLKHTPPLRP